LADQFVLARIVNMRGVELRRFEFDYDLTWAGFFLTKEGNVLGRFGSRDAESADKYLTLDGLKHALAAALAAHRSGERAEPPAQPADQFTRVEDYPSAKRLKSDACIHCHQVYNFRQDWLRSQGAWTKAHVWEYPQPETLGLIFDVNQQNLVKSVTRGSAAQRGGLRVGDEIHSIDGHRTASYADVQHELHRARSNVRIAIRWQREGRKHESDLELPDNWRESDISWRASMWNLEPAASVHGPDLAPRQKAELGLEPKRLAFRQGNFVPPPAAEAGIRAGDVIVGIDGKRLEMTMVQFNAYIRLNFKPGETVVYNLLRDGKKLAIPMKLPTK
jgi:hypothetical protein